MVITDPEFSNYYSDLAKGSWTDWKDDYEMNVEEASAFWCKMWGKSNLAEEFKLSSWPDIDRKKTGVMTKDQLMRFFWIHY